MHTNCTTRQCTVWSLSMIELCDRVYVPYDANIYSVCVYIRPNGRKAVDSPMIHHILRMQKWPMMKLGSNCLIHMKLCSHWLVQRWLPPIGGKRKSSRSLGCEICDMMNNSDCQVVELTKFVFAVGRGSCRSNNMLSMLEMCVRMRWVQCAEINKSGRCSLLVAKMVPGKILWLLI